MRLFPVPTSVQKRVTSMAHLEAHPGAALTGGTCEEDVAPGQDKADDFRLFFGQRHVGDVGILQLLARVVPHPLPLSSGQRSTLARCTHDPSILLALRLGLLLTLGSILGGRAHHVQRGRLLIGLAETVFLFQIFRLDASRRLTDVEEALL
eukprot:scaffold7506_cov286-Pinguiococcus_pyrenoidosus.AAC.10